MSINWSEMRLTQPDVKLSRDKTGAFNFQKLAVRRPQHASEPHAPPATPRPPTPTQPLDLSIRHLAIDQGQSPSMTA